MLFRRSCARPEPFALRFQRSSIADRLSVSTRHRIKNIADHYNCSLYSEQVRLTAVISMASRQESAVLNVICRMTSSSTMVAVLVILLTSCFGSGMAQVQSFLVAPSDVRVTQGQTAILKCQVAHMKGSLQWTKNGFALGFQRSIPGFPRYKMEGSIALGENHLVIDRAQLEDDAQYQCQVGPSGGDPPLLGKAVLSVTVPPSPPSIEGHQNGSVIKVSHRVASHSITCTSNAAKPAATFRWLRNGVELSAPGGSGDPSPAVLSVEYSKTQSAVHSKLEDSKSVLTIVPRDEDNEAYYSCLAENAAVQRPFQVTVQLNVQHPPGPPEISGYSSGQVLKNGDTAKLVCVSRGGNPLAQVYWFRNGEKLDFSYVTGNNRAENELIFTVQPNDNSAIYQCQVSNQMTSEPLTTEVRLVVQFAPKNVTISGHQNAKSGDTIKLRCESAISNPPAVISWFTKGRPLSGGVSRVQPSIEGGFVTISELAVMVTERENEVIYQCHGTNEALGQTQVDTITLKVMYPPERPTITGFIDGKSVAVGNAQTLTCTSNGGNPPATLRWFKGSREITTAVNKVTGNLVSSQVSFILEPHDNNAEYRCSASSPATSTPLVASVRLKVSFPPKTLEISLSPQVVKVGEPVTITCRSSSSNPASKLSWWKGGDEVTGAIDGGTASAEHGGLSTESRLELKPTVEDHGADYACRATNTLLEQAVSDSVTLNVLYKPYFPSEVQTNLAVVEKRAVTINATAVGNPSNITYSWYRGVEKLALGAPRFRLVGGAIEALSGFERAEAGTYTCEALNAEGLTRHDINIDVHYPAEIRHVPTETIVNSGDSVTIECEVRANPINVDKLITWSRVGYDFDSRTTIEYPEPGKSRLKFSAVDRTDAGLFECRASNGVGSESLSKAKLVVRFAPIIDKSPVYVKAAASNGTTATLICRAEGFPAVTFAWSKDETGETLPPSSDSPDSGRFVIGPTTSIGALTYEGTLLIHNTTKNDYASYKCVASNDLGTDMTLVTLYGTSRPDSPYALRIVNSTHNSLTIAWNPGFNGGLPQKFQIRYRKVGTDETKYADVLPYGATTYTLTELTLATEYEMSVVASNAHGPSLEYSESVQAKTAAVAPLVDEGPSEDIPLIIILIVCIVGAMLLALNILLIMFFIRRRRKKMETETSDDASQANTVELFNAPTVYTDDKNYTTFDQRSVEDLVDDCKRPYNPSEELSPFFSTTDPFYPASRYYGYGQPAPPRHRPPGAGDVTIYPDGSMSRGWDTGYGGPYGSVGRSVGLPEQNEEDHYKEQLRRMQRSMSPGSQQLVPHGYDPRNNYDAPSPPVRPLSFSNGHTRSYPQDEMPRYGPAPDTSYSSSSLRKPDTSGAPPEVRGYLV